jgi:hypothetical protein
VTARSLARQWLGLDRALEGAPGVRDPDSPCVGFVPGVPEGSWCETDGHYLCRECVEAPSQAPYEDSYRSEEEEEEN